MKNIIEVIISIIIILGVSISAYSDKQISVEEEKIIKGDILKLLKVIASNFSNPLVVQILTSQFTVDVIYKAIINFLLPQIKDYLQNINLKFQLK
jgi:hypothetical protein